MRNWAWLWRCQKQLAGPFEADPMDFLGSCVHALTESMVLLQYLTTRSGHLAIWHVLWGRRVVDSRLECTPDYLKTNVKMQIDGGRDRTPDLQLPVHWKPVWQPLGCIVLFVNIIQNNDNIKKKVNGWYNKKNNAPDLNGPMGG